MSKTTELVERLRELPRDTRKATVEIYDLCIEASYEIEELTDRCARYAEEIVVPATRGDAFRRMSDRELAEELFRFRFDGYAKAQGAETVLPDTIKSIESWLKEEMGK